MTASVRLGAGPSLLLVVAVLLYVATNEVYCRRLRVRMMMMSVAKNGSANSVLPWHVLCRTRCHLQHAADATDIYS
jgi:hypothetical protein